MAILTMLTLPIKNMGDLSIFESFLQFLSLMFCSFHCRGLSPLYYINSQVFNFFEATVNGVVFLISLSEDSSLMNRNALDLCILILYPATLLNSFISSRSFLVAFFGSSKYRNKSSVNTNRDSLSSSFPIRIPLISLVCLIALARVSRTILGNSYVSRNLLMSSKFSILLEYRFSK
uniref:Uncharacterized protein n=1 Tax=Sciurus vulgaris TaxID=55149 RepID=A0A8D2BCH3_SCIVU